MKVEAAPEATAAPYAKASFVHADVFALPFETPFDVLLDSAVFHGINVGDSDDAQVRHAPARRDVQAEGRCRPRLGQHVQYLQGPAITSWVVLPQPAQPEAGGPPT